MFISRFLALSLLSSVCVAQVAAPSPPSKTLASPPLGAKTTYPQPAFDLQSPGPGSKAGTSLRVLQFQPPVRLPERAVAQNNTCYFIQAYRFTRDNPESDALRYTGQSTCAPVAQFQLKEADGQVDIAPR